ncbi:MAG: F0F1 ATP synthase subunit delta [Patescibacteria group bacterium]|jgi:F-type H+-transporting ATPase subunit delta
MNLSAYAKAYLATTAEMLVTEQLGWLMAFEDKRAARTLRRVAASGGADTLVSAFALPVSIARFLGVLAEDRVLAKLPEIASLALTAAAHDGVGTAVRVVTALPLSVAERQAVFAPFGERAVAEFREDARIGGGMRITIGGVTVDHSLAARAQALRQALTTA